MTVKSTSDSTESADVCLSWNRTDAILIGALGVCTLVTRFWRLDYPNEPVFDEVQFVGQALAYLRNEQFLDVHPNLPKLLIAIAIKLLGHHSWVWRTPSACLGAALVVVAYMLAREMFRSRLAAALSSLFVLCDGMFFIHSRLAMLEIFHVAFTSTSYLLLFQLVRTWDPVVVRRKVLLIGIVSGAAMASKLVIPEIAFLLVIGFMFYHMLSPKRCDLRITDARVIGTVLLLGSVSAMVYLATFLPNYWLGWWGGAWSLFHYYHEVIWNLGQMAETTNRFVSDWWSWPLMLRAPLYWQNVTDDGLTATIWEGGNPIIWWSSLAALVITIVREFEQPTLARSFILIGYFAYMGALALSKHPFFLYIYMTPVYLQFLALGAVLSDCWNKRSRRWEDIVLIVSLVPALWMGLGMTIGAISLLVIVLAYAILAQGFDAASRLVCLLTVAASLAAFAYFSPMWVGRPLTSDSYNSRIWLTGPGGAQWM